MICKLCKSKEKILISGLCTECYCKYNPDEITGKTTFKPSKKKYK